SSRTRRHPTNLGAGRNDPVRHRGLDGTLRICVPDATIWCVFEDSTAPYEFGCRTQRCGASSRTRRHPTNLVAGRNDAVRLRGLDGTLRIWVPDATRLRFWAVGASPIASCLMFFEVGALNPRRFE